MRTPTFLKRSFLMSLSFLVFTTVYVHAQNVGVNDNGAAPNSNAILDVDVSTNDKGVLLPRLSTAERTTLGGSLGAGEKGLIVFDENLASYFYWDGNVWQQVLNTAKPDDDWTRSGPNVYNDTDSIGIGVALPDSRLHVLGKTKLEGDVDVHGVLDMTNSDILLDVNSRIRLDYFGSGYMFNVNNYTNWGTYYNSSFARIEWHYNGLMKGYFGLASGSMFLTNFLQTQGGVHVGTSGPANPGTGNLKVDGTTTLTGDVFMSTSRLVDGAFDIDMDGTSNINNLSLTGDFSTLGNLGIGTTNPVQPLDVVGYIRNDVPSATYDVWIQAGTSTASGDNRNLAILGSSELSGDRLYINYNSEYQGGTILGTNVGIGTVNPTQALDVSGNAHIEDNLGIGTTLPLTKLHVVNPSQGYIRLENGFNGVYSQWSSHSSIPWMGTSTAHAFGLVTSNSFRLYVGSNGNVGIGTLAPSQKLDVFGNVRVNGRLGIGTDNPLFPLHMAEDTLSVNGLEIANLGSSNLGLDGDIVPYGGSGLGFDLGNNAATEHWDDVVASEFITYSDMRTKNDMNDMQVGLTEILALRPVEYRYKAIITPDDRLRFGLIAREAETVLPNIVVDEDIDVDPDTGEIIRKATDYKAINYMDLIPVLIKSIQDQQEYIRAQEERIEQISDELAAIKAHIGMAN